MLIKIIRGTYGLNIGGNIKPKTCGDLPFHVEPDEAKRLARLGVAKIIGAGAITPAKGTEGEPETNPETSPEVPADDDGEGYEVEDVPEERGVPEYSEDSTNAELQAIAKEYGVELPQRANKSQILDALDDYFGGAPEISAKEPE